MFLGLVISVSATLQSMQKVPARTIRYYPYNFTAKLLTLNFSETVSIFPLRVFPSSILKFRDLPNTLPLISSQYHSLFSMACLEKSKLTKRCLYWQLGRDLVPCTWPSLDHRNVGVHMELIGTDKQVFLLAILRDLVNLTSY